MALRLLIVVGLIALFAAAPSLYRRRRRRLQQGPALEPLLPSRLLDGAERTWVVFTTPWCATCGPVEERLRASDPDARVVRVDATVEHGLARSHVVRSAPTVLLADRDGRVRARLVGAEAVDRYWSVTR